MTTFSSSFTGSDEDPLSESGVWEAGYTSTQTFQRISNLVRTSTINGSLDAVATYDGATFHENQEIQMRLSAAVVHGTDYAQVGPIGRASAPATKNFYLAQASGDLARLDKAVSNTFTNIAFVAQVWAANDNIKLKIEGRSQTLYRNAVAMLYGTDSSITGSGRIGMLATRGSATSVADGDDFSGGDSILTVSSYRDFPKPKMRAQILAGRVI